MERVTDSALLIKRNLMTTMSESSENVTSVESTTNKGGRPLVVFGDEQIAQVEALAAVLNQTQLSDYFGISHTTFIEVCKRQEDVSLAYKRGRAKAVNDIGGSMLKQAKEGNTSAAIFYLKTQAGWKEQDNQGKEPQPINIQIVKPDGGD